LSICLDVKSYFGMWQYYVSFEGVKLL